MRKRSDKEIEERTSNLESNLFLIKSDKGKQSIQEQIDILKKFKNKSDIQIINSFGNDGCSKDKILAWLVGAI